MRPRSVVVSAKGEQDAMDKALKKLDASPENVRVEPAGPGKFSVHLTDSDAEIEIEVSDDNMTATVVSALPSRGSGTPLNAKRLVEALENKGVHLPPITEAAKFVLKTLGANKEVSNVVIARGTPPEPAQDAKLDPIGDWNYPVFPNDAMGTIIPAVNAKPGKSLSGHRVSPSGGEHGKGLNLLQDGGCFIDQTAFLVRAEQYGIPHSQHQDIWVDSPPLLRISKNYMKVLATIYPKDFRGNKFTIERMRAALEAVGITGAIDSPALISAIEQAVETGEPVKEVVICRGVEPIDGEDGWFEMLVKDERSEVGKLDRSDRMDFRARGVVRSVKKGEVLGRLHAPKAGTPGRDVKGKVIPARDGVPLHLQPGDNVETSESGHEFTAADEGMVLFIGNRLSVTDVFETSGDVNMATGNINIEKGSVLVKGAILSGFTVQSPGNVVVNDVIENATVTSGGDIEVKGGIIMDTSGGKVTSGGGVSALYAKNATIVADGDVNIAHELSNCIVFAGRKVIATKGRGKIIGSTVRAGKGVEAKVIGSDLGVETTIFLGIERRSFSEEIGKKRQLQGVLQKIYGTLGSGDPKTILAKAAPEKRQAVASLLKARLRAEKLIKEIETTLEEERKRVREAVKARVIVHDTLHPGTIINCFGSTLRVSEPMHHCQIFYDPQEEKVVIAQL